MNWIEIIHLRAGNINESENVLNIFNQIKIIPEKDNHVKMRFFKDATIPSDFTIVLEWKCNSLSFNSTPLKSVQGIRFAENLKKLGLVNHTIFVEEKVK